MRYFIYFFTFIIASTSLFGANNGTKNSIRAFCRGFNTPDATRYWDDINNWADRQGINPGDNGSYYNTLQYRAPSLPDAADYVYMVYYCAGNRGNRAWRKEDARIILQNKDYEISRFYTYGDNMPVLIVGGVDSRLVFNKFDVATVTGNKGDTSIRHQAWGTDFTFDCDIYFSNKYTPKSFHLENNSDGDITFLSTKENPNSIYVEDTTSSAKNTLVFQLASFKQENHKGYESGDFIIYSDIYCVWDVSFQGAHFSDYNSQQPGEVFTRGSIYLLGDKSNFGYFCVKTAHAYLGKTDGAYAIGGAGRTFTITSRGMVTLLGNEQIEDNLRVNITNPQYYPGTDPVTTEPITAGVLNLNGFSERVGNLCFHMDGSDKFALRFVLDYGAGGEQYFCCSNFNQYPSNNGNGNANINLKLSRLQICNYVLGEDHFYSQTKLSTQKYTAGTASNYVYSLSMIEFKGFGVRDVDYKVKETGPFVRSINGKNVLVYEYTPEEVE